MRNTILAGCEWFVWLAFRLLVLLALFVLVLGASVLASHLRERLSYL